MGHLLLTDKIKGQAPLQTAGISQQQWNNAKRTHIINGEICELISITLQSPLCIWLRVLFYQLSALRIVRALQYLCADRYWPELRHIRWKTLFKLKHIFQGLYMMEIHMRKARLVLIVLFPLSMTSNSQEQLEKVRRAPVGAEWFIRTHDVISTAHNE